MFCGGFFNFYNVIGDTLKKIELSKRLQKASEFAVPNRPILDVGSDHANLPIYLVQEGKVPAAVAGEVVKGPYEYAKSKIDNNGLEKKISIRLGDGLDVIDSKDTIGTIFICGMGGFLITNILKNGLKMNKLSQNTRLVLQPNHGEESVREFLDQAGYEIIDEAILEEKGKYYEIIVAEYTNSPKNYTNLEYIFGPKLLKSKSAIFTKKWEDKKLWFENVLEKIKQTQDAEKVHFLKNKIKQIEQVIS